MTLTSVFAGSVGRTAVIALTWLALTGAAAAEPLGLLDRNGSYVAIEPYAPNIVRVTLSLEKERVVAPAGYGFIASPDVKGWKHTVAESGDVFTSPALSVEVKAQPRPGPPSQMQRYFAPSLPPVSHNRAQAHG